MNSSPHNYCFVRKWIYIHYYLLTIKPTICTNFSNLFLDYNSTCFGQFLCPSSGVFHCTQSITYRFADSLRAGSGRNWSCSQAVSKPVWHIPLLCVQWKTPDDGQRNCPKHVEFYSKNKFEKLVLLVGFIIRIYHDAWSPERPTLLPIKILFLHEIWKRHFFSGQTVWHGFSMAEFDDVICGYKLRQSRIQFWRCRNPCLQCCHSDWICYIKLIPMNISFQRSHFSNLHYDSPDDKKDIALV